MSRLDPATVDRLLAGVDEADAEARRAWPGPSPRRQPVQVLYVPADRLAADTTRAAGRRAADLLARHAPDGASLADATGIPVHVADRVHARLEDKLATEPVEDLRVDFEDGYGTRTDAQEDGDADTAARHLANVLEGPAAPPFCGLRVKSFSDGLARRSVATLDRFLATLLSAHGGLPPGFVITFPKIVAVAHVAAFVDVLVALEDLHGLDRGVLGFEAQVEVPATVLDRDGTVPLRAMRRVADGRLRAAHVGVFDYTAALGLPAASQRLDHPALDFARHVLRVTFADTEVALSDGSTNLRPADDSRDAVVAVWRQHAAHVRHSLADGWVQGWDLDASHLVPRYATVYAHLLDGLDEVVVRLSAWHAGDDAAGSPGPTMDEPATVRVLERQVARALACGAATDDDLAGLRAATTDGA